MAKHIVFTDAENPSQKLKFYLNTDDRLYLEAGLIDDLEDYYIGWVTLDKQDVYELINELKRLTKQM